MIDFNSRSHSHHQVKAVSRLSNDLVLQLSSSILQHSVSQLSFAKAERFPALKLQDNLRQIQLTDTKNKRSASFGFGQKQLKSHEEIRKDKLIPGPGHYEQISKKPAGHSFGIRPNNSQVFQVPGPGAYDVKKQIKSPKFSMYPRIEPINDHGLKPKYYIPNEYLVLNHRFSKIGFGVGQRFKDQQSSLPGPGSYEIKSKF